MDEDIAQQLSHEINIVLDEFLQDLTSRTSSKEFTNLLFDQISLSEVKLGYKPETYTRFNLVEPLLEVVGLDHQLEPRSVGVHRKRWPDFEITGSAIPYIGEVKAINDVQRGKEDIREYLGIEGFISPYGILTDGIDWYIFGPPEDGGRTSNPVERKHISLSHSLQTVASAEGHWEMNLLSSQIKKSGVSGMEQFPKIFHPDEIDVWALEKMPKQYRQDFLEKNRSLQASLEGVWE